MDTLSPIEYHFLSSPIQSSGDKLFKLTLQYLVLQNVIEIEQRKIIVNERDDRYRSRYFFMKGPEFETYSPNEGEKFILQLFDKYDEFRMYILKHHIREAFPKLGIDQFKRKFVRPDIERKRLTGFRRFPNAEARKSLKDIRSQLKSIDQGIDMFLAGDLDYFSNKLERLGYHVLGLKEATLDKIDKVSSQIRALNRFNLDFPLSNGYHFVDHMMYSAVGSFSLNYGTFGGFDGGGFDGFGGGDFGGGGSFGDW